MTYSAEVLADSPLAYYRLGEASGTTLVDSSGNGHSGTYNAAPTFGQPGLVGDTDTAVAFSGGINSYASVPNGTWLDFSAGFTVEAVIATPVITDYEIVATDVFEFMMNGAGNVYINAHYTDATINHCQGGTIAAGTATHIAATYDGANLTAYLNGVQVATAAKAATHANPTSALVLASCPDFTDINYSGVLDEVAVYGHALTAARIAAHAAYVSGGITTPPIATDTTVGSYGYSYTGTGTLDYDPPVVPTPAHVSRAHVRRVSRSLPTPTLTDGSPR